MSSEVAAVPVSTDEKSCQDLLDAVVQHLNEGRTVNEVSAELVRQKWSKPEATQFCQLAAKICRELKALPEQRAHCAKRGFETMQGAYGWLGFGACAGLMMYMVDSARPYAVYAIVPFLYGVVELVSGLMLWWPHRDFYKPEPQKPKSS